MNVWLWCVWVDGLFVACVNLCDIIFSECWIDDYSVYGVIVVWIVIYFALIVVYLWRIFGNCVMTVGWTWRFIVRYYFLRIAAWLLEFEISVELFSGAKTCIIFTAVCTQSELFGKLVFRNVLLMMLILEFVNSLPVCFFDEFWAHVIYSYDFIWF